MSSVNIDEVLSKLSTKFNKIFYDREFVCCVNEDFQVVLKNKHSCCVVVFPVLGPNYLKAVRYQAKISDLAVFTLGSGRIRAIAVCRKEFLRINSNEVAETSKVQIMPQSSKENSNISRRKRPERQLYVPPAQRRVSVTTEEIPYNNETYSRAKNEVVNTKRDLRSRNYSKDLDKNLGRGGNKQHDLKTKCKPEHVEECADVSDDKKLKKDFEKESDIRCLDYMYSINYVCILWRYGIAKNCPTQNQQFSKFAKYFLPDKGLLLYNNECGSKLNTLHILYRNCVLWQPKFNIYPSYNGFSINSQTYPLFDFEQLALLPCECSLENRIPIFSIYNSDELKSGYTSLSKNFDYLECSSFKVLWNNNQRVSESDVIVDLSVINCGHNFIISNKNGNDYFYECLEDHDIFLCYQDKKQQGEKLPTSTHTNGDSLLKKEKTAPLIKSDVIVLEDQLDVGLTKDKASHTVRENNDKNTSSYKAVIPTSNKILKTPKKSSEHDQEKEIMRKTKENINRKSRPIMKYMDDTADTLKIEKNDVNNWEELFDDDGQLQDELFKEVTQKVGSDVTIVKAKEDYSDYVTKQSEELEHMVELYDFPPTLETHDIIQAFSVINSEAMYVKWVDDTHAILVLGSLTQAQRAIELDNPLIKVRPMAAASGMSLATAYKHDLKPAMKRPQTNLQTARRLITTHLGTKSRISKEQSTKERDDLKAARELKRLAKRNEQAAWEGTLRSSIN